MIIWFDCCSRVEDVPIDPLNASVMSMGIMRHRAYVSSLAVPSQRGMRRHAMASATHPQAQHLWPEGKPIPQRVFRPIPFPLHSTNSTKNCEGTKLPMTDLNQVSHAISQPEDVELTASLVTGRCKVSAQRE